MNQSKQMARIAVKALEEKKALDLKIIDISDVSVVADYFIIVSGSNRIKFRHWPIMRRKCLEKKDLNQSRLKDIALPTGF